MTVWLDKDMQWFAQPTGKARLLSDVCGRSYPILPEHQMSAGFGAAPGLGFRPKSASSGGPAMACAGLQHAERSPANTAVQLPYRPSVTALDLLVDSTGIKFLCEGEWKRKKHGAQCRRQLRKVHMGIDAQTLEIRAIEVTDNSVGDAPMLGQILTDEPVASISADGAYDAKACHAAKAQWGAQAVIPPCKNAKAWKHKSEGVRVRN